MSRGRPKAEITRISTKVGLTPLHHRMFEHLGQDFFTGRRSYGIRDKHVDKALEEYFQRYYPDIYAAEKLRDTEPDSSVDRDN